MERDDSRLVEHLGWVQRLALSLARDRDAADDLTQDVARVWLEKRPALAGGPRSWLAAVTRKLALDRARSDISRKARERSAARPEGESFEVVERGARQRRVVEAVMQLAEPYRSTILYRYLDGLSTSEVAERMGVPEATVRKRIERGLALLRERLDREFGSKSNAWAFALLEPGLRTAVLKGVGVMSMKWIGAAGAVVLLAGVAWYVRDPSASVAPEAVGGTGVVVPLEVAAAREKPQTGLEVPGDSPRAAVEAANRRSPGAPGLRGFIFVDDVRGAPADLVIAHRVGHLSAGEAPVDAANATWSLEPLEGEPGHLWITSSSTIPARIPIPAEIWAGGGVFDIHLSSGRSLALTFLDRVTKQGLANIEFEASRSIVVERGSTYTSTDGNQTRHKTDAQGKALITGIPLEGFVAVRVDASSRERDIVLRGGETSRIKTQRQPDWQTWLKKEQPPQLEQTIFVSPPVGEACASGQVPAWAIALAGSPEAVRVVARETSNETPQARGMPFRLPQDAQGHFELCANAPATLVVWLERTEGREFLSDESELAFEHPGAQDPILFRELTGSSVMLHFVHVPSRGNIQATVSGKTSRGAAQFFECKGADFDRQLSVATGDQIQLVLYPNSGPGQKSGWIRQIQPGDQHQFTIDLGGSERTLKIESAELGALVGAGSIGLMRVENGEVSVGQSITVVCEAGRAMSAAHIPNGRWLYRYYDKDQDAVWGVIEVNSATQPGEELVLRPRLRLASRAELQPAIRFDEIEGVSLTNLPAQFRSVSPKGETERVALPIDAKYVTLEGK